MAINKFTPTSPDPNIQQDSDMTTAKFGHLNTLINNVNNELQNLNASKNIPELSLKGVTTIPNGKIWAEGAVFKNTAIVRSQSTSNLYAYDIKDPDNPVLAHDFGTVYYQGFYFDGYLLIGYQASPNPDLIEFWDMSDVYNPVLLGQKAQNIGLVYEIIKKGNLVFIMDSSDSIYTFDVSDYSNIVYIGLQYSGSNVFQERGVDVGDNYLVSWGQNSGVRTTGTSILFKINWNAGTLNLLSRVDSLDFIALGVKAYGDKFVVAGQNMTTLDYGFKICTIENSLLVDVSPFIKSKYTFTNYNTEDNWGYQMRLLNDYLFLSSKEGHILLYDIKDPNNITLKQDFDLSSVMVDIRALPSDSNLMFVASRTDVTDVAVLELNDFSSGVLNTGELAADEIYSQNGFISALTTYSHMSNRSGIQDAKIVNLNASKKFLYPKYTTAQRTALTAEAGEAVYDTDTNKLYIYDGTTWQAAW